jgi:hypothetical protein
MYFSIAATVGSGIGVRSLGDLGVRGCLVALPEVVLDQRPDRSLDLDWQPMTVSNPEARRS